MKKSYTLNLVKTASDDYIKDIKQAMIDKGIVEETVPDNELDEAISSFEGGGTPINYGPILNSDRIINYQDRIATELPNIFDQIISDGIELYKYEFSVDTTTQKMVSTPVKVTQGSDMPFYQLSNILIIGIDENTINTLASNLGIDSLNIILLISMGYVTTWGFKKKSNGFKEYIINLNDVTLCINIVFISGIIDFSAMGIPTAFNNPSYCHISTTD